MTPPPAAPSIYSRRRVLTIAAVSVGGALTACTARPEVETPIAGARSPAALNTTAPAAKLPDVELPLTWTQTPAVKPGWSLIPQQREGFFLGFHIPDTEGNPLRYIAADSTGKLLWQAERPATCTGYTVSTANSTPIGVLTDARVDGNHLQTCASAYDLADGHLLWGPVDVPGPLQGPGLVFAAPAPASVMGPAGPRMALSATSGSVIADEQADTTRRVIGEYDGTVIVADSRTLTALDAATGNTRWATDHSNAGVVTAPADAAVPVGAALVSTPDQPQLGLLIDVATGTVIGRNVRDAGYESLTDTWITVGPTTVKAVHQGRERWATDTPQGTRIAAVGGGVVYLNEGKQLKVLNSITGKNSQSYPTDSTRPFAVPQAISRSGAAIIAIDQEIYLLPGA